MSITPRRHVAVGLLCRAAGLGLGIIADTSCLTRKPTIRWPSSVRRSPG
ncbi:adenosylcobinamide-phosphate synthase [Cutibacterium acnes JCM 18916]|nr:adenosylcobinamide-phosphate synthase [Cutibacterium acnes JCM 18916]